MLSAPYTVRCISDFLGSRNRLLGYSFFLIRVQNEEYYDIACVNHTT
jgi:hypothetical protein